MLVSLLTDSYWTLPYSVGNSNLSDVVDLRLEQSEHHRAEHEGREALDGFEDQHGGLSRFLSGRLFHPVT